MCLTVRHISFVAFPMVSCYNLLATQFNKTSFGEVRFCFGKNASPALHFSKEVKAASRQGSSAFFGAVLRCRAFFMLIRKQPEEHPWLLRFKICFVKVRRIEEIRDIDIQALANLVNQAELDRIVGAIHDVSNRGFRHTAFHI